MLNITITVVNQNKDVRFFRGLVYSICGYSLQLNSQILTQVFSHQFVFKSQVMFDFVGCGYVSGDVMYWYGANIFF